MRGARCVFIPSDLDVRENSVHKGDFAFYVKNRSKENPESSFLKLVQHTNQQLLIPIYQAI